MSIDLFTAAVVSSFNDLNYLHFVSVADFKKGEQLSLRTYWETIIIKIDEKIISSIFYSNDAQIILIEE